MKINKITPEKLQEMIKKEAEVIKRKKELYEQVKQISSEVMSLNENYSFAGTFGFASPTDKHNVSPTGFVNTPNISHLARLEAEMAHLEEVEEQEAPVINEDQLNELDSLKRENEALKSKLESIGKLFEGKKSKKDEEEDSEAKDDKKKDKDEKVSKKGLTAGQKKLPDALQKAILAKQK